MRCSWSWAVATVVLCWATIARGQESGDTKGPRVSVTVTDDFELRYWVRDERLEDFEDRAIFNYFEQVNRLNLSMGVGPWIALLQVDQVMLTANRYILDGETHTERDLLSRDLWGPFERDFYLNPEKIGVRWTRGDVDLRLGDFYGAFGTGLALNLNRNVDIDIDTSIQGVQVLYRAGSWDLTALVGQANRQQVFMDNPNLGIYGDRRHMIGGVRLVRYGLGPADLGLHGTVFDFVEDTGMGPGFRELGSTPDVVMGGATAELYGVAGIDFLLEADVLGFPTDVAWGGEDPEAGYALYGSAAWYVGRTTWQLEGKRYRNAERPNAVVGAELYEVVVGPTLEYERSITEDSSATMNSNDVFGARLRMDVTAADGQVIPYVSVAVHRDLEMGGLHFNSVPETVLHPLVGAEVFAEDLTVLANAGYRYDARDGDGFGSDADADRQLHGDLELKFPLVDSLHFDLALAGEWYRWGDNPLQQTDYGEVESSVGLLWGSDLAVTWFTDFTNNPLVGSTGNLSDAVYGALEVQYKPTDAVTLKAFGGAYKAGIRCAGGQCRLLPGFEGVKVSATGTF
jgi:hypothetical protein